MSLLDHALLARLGAISVKARYAMSGNSAGHHRSLNRGSSSEFAEYRKYVKGDDTRRLDWKAFARSDRYYIKEFEADTNLRAYFVIDNSGSMNFTGAGISKIEYARKIIANLAYLIVNQGDAAGLSVCGESLHIEIPPQRRPSHLKLIIDTLTKLEPIGKTGLITALHSIAEKIQQRAIVIILSDFFCDSLELNEAIQHLRYRKHDICAFHLMDQQEIAFQFDRPLKFTDMEDHTTIIADPNLINHEYHLAMNEFLQNTRYHFKNALTDYHIVTTDQSLEPLLSDFLLNRLPKRSKR
jgi:uncharacterized protein (DUF58 family)